MISHELKIIFIHIPKCAGTSMTNFLKKYSSNRIILTDDLPYRGAFVDPTEINVFSAKDGYSLNISITNARKIYYNIFNGHRGAENIDKFFSRITPEKNKNNINYNLFCNSLPQIKNVDLREIKDPSVKHENIYYFRKVYGSKIDDYFKFSIVRNPYDRILSYYFYIIKRARTSAETKLLLHKAWIIKDGKKIFNNKQFFNFVPILSKQPPNYEKMGKQQSTTEFDLLNRGCHAPRPQCFFVDSTVRIIKYENMLTELKSLDFMKNMDISMFPKSNVSHNSKLDWRKIIASDKILRDSIYNYYKKDFDTFGYEYDV